MLKNIVSLVLLLFSLFTFSQQNYLPGYVINTNGDTLKGFIDYRNWDRNPSEINFKSELENGNRAFTPLDIIEFGVHDEIYIGRIIDIETSPEMPKREKPDSELHLRLDTVFLQALYIGEKSLYHYRLNDGKDLFYISQNSDLELLVYKKYLKKLQREEATTIDQIGHYSVLKNNKYRGQLILYFDDYPIIKERISSTTYTKESIIKLFNQKNSSRLCLGV